MVDISDMSGKAALVTGAASGLGRATALALAQAGVGRQMNLQEPG